LKKPGARGLEDGHAMSCTEDSIKLWINYAHGKECYFRND